MNRLNLIPEPMQLVRTRRRLAKRWTVCVLVAAFILVVPLLVDQYRKAEAARLRIESAALRTQLASHRATLATLTAEADQSLVHLQRAEALRSKRAWSSVFALVADRLPAGCWLTSLATDPATPQAGGNRTRVRQGSRPDQESETPITIDAPRRIEITGYAAEPAEPYQFVTNLKQAGVFRDVNLRTSRREQIPEGSYFRFELFCEW